MTDIIEVILADDITDEALEAAAEEKETPARSISAVCGTPGGW